MMRQLFNSFVHLVRGTEHVVDFNQHTHAHYTVCDNTDMLSFPVFSLSWDPEQLAQAVRKGFFSRKTTPADGFPQSHEGAWGAEDRPAERRCVNRVDVWYLFLPTFATHTPVLEYFARVRDRVRLRRRMVRVCLCAEQGHWGSAGCVFVLARTPYRRVRHTFCHTMLDISRCA